MLFKISLSLIMCITQCIKSFVKSSYWPCTFSTLSSRLSIWPVRRQITTCARNKLLNDMWSRFGLKIIHLMTLPLYKIKEHKNGPKNVILNWVLKMASSHFTTQEILCTLQCQASTIIRINLFISNNTPCRNYLDTPATKNAWKAVV